MFQIIGFVVIIILAIASGLSVLVEKFTTGRLNVDMLLAALSCVSVLALIVSLV